MQRLLLMAALILASIPLLHAQEDPYPPGTVRMTPQVELGLESVPLVVPEEFAGLVPEGLRLNLPPGFTVRVFAANLAGPRFMAWSPEGVLHVANMKAGGADQFEPAGNSRSQIVALPDRDGDGVADTVIVVADDLRWAHSLAFFRGDMYVADTHQIVKFSQADAEGVFQERTVFADDIPTASTPHITRTIVADERNDKIYLSVGSTCDVCRERTDERAAVLEFDGDGTGRRIFAQGLRNAIGLTLHPLTNELWATNNGHTERENTLPPEWIDIVRDGGFYGWPFAYAYQTYIDFERTGSYRRMLPLSRADSTAVERMQRPAALIAAHLAPMAIHFYDGERFPTQYRQAAFVACRAGFRGPDPGHKVVALFVEPDGANARVGDFLTGFWPEPPNRSTIWGNPVGLATDRQGALYLSSDWINHLVFKIEFDGIDAQWEGALPDTLVAGVPFAVDATIRLRGVGMSGEAPRVRADLSAWGGAEALPLTAENDSTFRLQVSLPTDGPKGPRSLAVYIDQPTPTGPRRGSVVQTVVLMPGEDLLILGDELAVDWQARPAGALEPLGFAADGPVYAGETAVPLRAVGDETGWTLSLEPDEPVDRFGYRALGFAFHPGDVIPASDARMKVSPRPLGFVDFLASGQVDLSVKQWQKVEIPLPPSTQGETLNAILFTSNVKGTFFIDQVRLITSFVQRPTAVLAEDGSPVAESFSLAQNYPNPFNNGTAIRFTLAATAQVELSVYNLMGQKVASLAGGTHLPGTYTSRWDGRGDDGQALASGVYFYRLRVERQQEKTRKLLLLR
jgi:glucose/arabinose dehydrogenase